MNAMLADTNVLFGRWVAFGGLGSLHASSLLAQIAKTLVSPMSLGNRAAMLNWLVRSKETLDNKGLHTEHSFGRV